MIFAFRSETGGGGAPFGIIPMNFSAGTSGSGGGGGGAGVGGEWLVRIRRKGHR